MNNLSLYRGKTSYQGEISKTKIDLSRNQDTISSISIFNWNGKKVDIDRNTKENFKIIPTLCTVYSGTNLVWERYRVNDIQIKQDSHSILKNKKDVSIIDFRKVHSSKPIGFLDLPKEIHDMIVKFLVPVKNYCEYFYGRAEGGIIGPVCKALRHVNRNLLKQSPERVAAILEKIGGNIESKTITSEGRHMLQEIAASAHTLDLRKTSLNFLINHCIVENLLKYFFKIKILKHNDSFQETPIDLILSKKTEELCTKLLPLMNNFIYEIMDENLDHGIDKLTTFFQCLSNCKELTLKNDSEKETTFKEILSIIVSVLPNLQALHFLFSDLELNNTMATTISKLTNLRELSVRKMSDGLKYIGLLQNLEILSLSSVDQSTINNLHYLNGLKKLKELKFYEYNSYDDNHDADKSDDSDDDENDCITIDDSFQKFDFMNSLDKFFNNVKMNAESMKTIILQCSNLKVFDCRGERNSINFLSCIGKMCATKEISKLLSELKILCLDIRENTTFPKDAIESIKSFRALQQLDMNYPTLEMFYQYIHLTTLRSLACIYIENFSNQNLNVLTKLSNLRQLTIGWINSDIQDIYIVLKQLSIFLPYLEELSINIKQLWGIEHIQFIIDNFKKLEFLEIDFDDQSIKNTIFFWKKWVLKTQKNNQ